MLAKKCRERNSWRNALLQSDFFEEATATFEYEHDYPTRRP
jgi:hypothetical protein